MSDACINVEDCLIQRNRATGDVATPPLSVAANTAAAPRRHEDHARHCQRRAERADLLQRARRRQLRQLASVIARAADVHRARLTFRRSLAAAADLTMRQCTLRNNARAAIKVRRVTHRAGKREHTHLARPPPPPPSPGGTADGGHWQCAH